MSSARGENEEELNRSLRFSASCAGGLEGVLARELRDAGAWKVQEFSRTVKFTASPSIGCRALVAARTAASVDEVLAVATGPLRGREDLYNFVKQARDWPSLIPPDATIRVGIILATRDVAQDLRHTHYSTLTVSKAITDACREATGLRPSVDLIAPDWMFHLVLHRGGATLARRWSGPRGLHRRGYRAGVKMHKAALRETTAAGVLLLAGLQTGQALRLVDPMCGSGTLVLEAAMITLGVTPGVVRDALAAPDEPWHAVPRKFHGVLKEEIAFARSRQCVPGNVMFEGSDAYPGALALARRCLAALERVMPGISQVVRFEVRGAAACFRGDQNPDGIRHLLCCNPPWGDRLDGTEPSGAESEIEGPSTPALRGPEEGLEALCASWRDLGELAHRFFGSVWILNPVSLSPELREEFHNAAYRRGATLTNAEQHLVDGGIRQTASHGKLGLEWSRMVLV